MNSKKIITKRTFIGKWLVLFLTILVFQNCQNPSVIQGPLFLPEGFESKVFIDSIAETTRHIAVSPNGNVYTKFKRTSEEGALAALQDLDKDGVAERIIKFANDPSIKGRGYATAARIYKGYLYFSSELAVYRYKLDPENLVPNGPLETVVIDDHPHGMHEHIGKPIAFDNKGNLYVPFGAPSNSCQNPKRTPLSPGVYPCPQLEKHGGIWVFDAETLNQTQEDGRRYATGIRSIVGMDWNSDDESLYAVVHGRDDLYRLWPDRYTPWDSAVLPSEEFLKIEEGDNFGWPYCYYDQIQGKRVLSPEYGGDGKLVGDCPDFKPPVMGFPGHWAPNDLVFYQGDAFPDYYKNGAFIAFHGSTNRAPYPQSGYFIGFVPFKNGVPTGEVDIFADGFAQVDPIISVRDAVYRPMGIAFAPDGTMYIGDTEKGRIWSVKFTGDKNQFGKASLEKMEARKLLSHFRTPDPDQDHLGEKNLTGGQLIYKTYCAACHQRNGKGASGRFPPLDKTDWVVGDKERLVHLVLNGMEGPIKVNGEDYNSMMPQHSFLKDVEIAKVLTYIRKNFGNDATAVTVEEVKKFRESNTKNQPK
ncbi:PQQ-dependent sugar dehydrogenase [Flavobacteriaceae bacterium]|nr:PQQ-dependent sugar dehydrogenase [Flavobacteriaceae bacterium]MDA9037502.1 PQQ-dependent sugar dehydrogenase [Flavobacteriaceae bacterium]MDC0872160.1 PQQ-dependent sugar dehydrogenase [Flavobacteriaceae bacterium]